MTKRPRNDETIIDIDACAAEVERHETRLKEIESTFRKFSLEIFATLKAHIVNRLEKESIYSYGGRRRRTLTDKDRNAIDKLFGNLDYRELSRLLNHDFAPLLLYKINDPMYLRERRQCPLGDFFQTPSRRYLDIQKAEKELVELRAAGWGGFFSGKLSKHDYDAKEKSLQRSLAELKGIRDYQYEKNEAILLEVCQHALIYTKEISALDSKIRWLRSQMNLANQENRTKAKLAIAAAATGKVRSEAATAKRKVTSSDICPYCGLTIQGAGHLDHIYPVSKGGLNIEANLIFCCVSCNAKKGDKGLYQFCAACGFDFEAVVRRLVRAGKHV
jgi:5-methylcytosine-specific restriction endonuclease McrA